MGEVACLHLCFLYLFQMVRTYKKKGMRGLWTEQDMQHAVDAVRQGEPLKTVAREYRVPRNTLRRHAGRDAPAKVKKRLGRKTVLSEEEECELHDIILDMENALYGLTRSDLQDLVFQFCCKNQIPNPFTTTEKAGRDWLNGFLQRNPEISIRKPENVSIGRAYGFSRHKLADFFTKYLKVIYNENGNRIIPNSNIYNADESGFTIDHRPEKILGQKGKRAIGTLTSAEKGKTITFLPAVSAVGHYVPPLFVFPRKRMKLELLENAPDGSIGAANPTGWINTEIFEEWFDHFLNVVQPKARPQPTLLIFDGQKAHTKNVSLIDKARDNKVVLISLPPHCTHKLQPLDRTFFKSLKSNYNHEVHLWMRDHRGMGLSQTKIPELIKLAYNKSANMENAANGFRVSGLVPPNEHIFCDEDYAASDNFIRQQALEAPNTPEDNDNANDVRLTTSNGPAIHPGPSSTGPSSTGASNVPVNQPDPSSTGASNVPVNQPGPSSTGASNVPANQPDPSSTGGSNVPVNQPGPSSTGASNVPANQPGPSSTGGSNVPVNQPGPSSTGASNVPANQPDPSSTGASNVPANQPGPSSTGASNVPANQPDPSSTGASNVPANQPGPSSTGASNVPANQPDPSSTGASNVPANQPGPSSTGASNVPANQPDPSSTGASNVPANQPGPSSTGASKVPANQPDPSSTGASNVPANQPDPSSTGASNVPANQPGPSSTGASNVPANQPDPSSTGASNVPANQPGPSSTGACNVPANQPDPSSTGGSNVPANQPGPFITVPSSTGASNVGLPANQPGPSSTVPFTVHEVTFRDILATMSPPHMGTKTKRKRKTERAEVITSSPYKRRLVAEHEERNKKELKKGASQKRQKENVKCTSTSKGKQRQRKKRVSPVRKQHSNMSKDTAKHRNGPRNHLVNFYCIYCNELFVDPPEFSWIQCSECKQWAHENETDYEGIGVFICDECR